MIQEYSTRFKTVWVILACAAAIAGWDLYARHFPAATISEIFLGVGTGHPLLPFLVGVLMGHLFWPQTREK